MVIKIDIIRTDGFGESVVYTRVERIEILDNNAIRIDYSVANVAKKTIYSKSAIWEQRQIFKVEITL